MTLEQAHAEFKAATEAYAAAKRGTENQRFAARHGMSHSLAFCEMVEHTAYHNWLRAHEKVVALQPAPAPRPTPAPKATVAVAPAKAAPKPTVASKVATVAAKPASAIGEPLTVASIENPSAYLQYLDDECRRSQNRVFARHGLQPRPRT